MYVAELGENFEGSFAAFVQKACDFSIARRYFPPTMLVGHSILTNSIFQ